MMLTKGSDSARAQLLLSADFVGSHIGPSTGHQTDRKLSLPFRCAVALTGHMGMEIDLRELSPHRTLNAEESGLGVTNCTGPASPRRHSAARKRTTPRSTRTRSSAKSRAFSSFCPLHGYSLNSVQGPLRISGLDPSRYYELSLGDKPEIPSSAMCENSILP